VGWVVESTVALNIGLLLEGDGTGPWWEERKVSTEFTSNTEDFTTGKPAAGGLSAEQAPSTME